jgi:hypothetical protein
MNFMRFSIFLALALLAAAELAASQPTGSTPQPRPQFNLAPASDGSLSQTQMQELLRVVAEKDLENDKRLRDYTYIERSEEHDLDGNGNPKSTRSETSEVMVLYGEQVERLIEKDDKPLSAKDAAKEEEKIQKITDKRKNESDEDRQKRKKKEAKEREDGRKFVLEVADAYNFKLIGGETLQGRDAWVVDAEPKPGYQPRMKEAKFLPKFRGRLWIDKDDLQLAKLDVVSIDTVSFGWVVARIHKGTRVVYEQTRVNDEVWLPRHVAFKVDARVALFKGYKMDGDVAYRDYRKFRTSTRIIDVGDLQKQK